MEIHKIRHQIVRSLVLFFAVVGMVTLFTNLSFNGAPVVASADVCELNYDADTKTLTVGPGDMPDYFYTFPDVKEAETIVFVSADASAQKVVAPEDSEWLFKYFTNVQRFQGMQNFDTSLVTNMAGMFYGCVSLKNLNLNGFDTSQVTDMSAMFYDCNSLESLNLNAFNTANVSTMSYMFYECRSLKPLNVSSFNTANVESMFAMFGSCVSLTSLDLRTFDTSKVGSMEYMFYSCSSVKTIDLSSFNTSNVYSMKSMFCRSSSLITIDLSSFNTTNLTNTEEMFFDCSSLKTLDLSSFDTSKVISMWNMFYECSGLETLDLSSFDTANVKSMYCMFTYCYKLKVLDLSGFNTANVTTMGFMFYACSSLTTLDLSNFDTSLVNDTGGMFNGMTGVWKLTLGPACIIGEWTYLPNPTEGTTFNSNYVVNSDKWIQATTGVEYSAEEIYAAHIAGVTDTYTWQWDTTTTVEYIIEPSYTITIPAQVNIPNATGVGTGAVTLSDYPKLPFDYRFIHVSAESNAATAWHLTNAGDTTGGEYDFYADDDVDLKAGDEIVFEANGEEVPTPQAVYAKLTDSSHQFKYAGDYKDTVTFKIETAAS